MKIEILQVGYLETNCYILSKGNDVIIIDPGDEAEKIEKAIEERKVVGIIITHYHDDHIGALDELERKYDAKIYDIYNLVEGENAIGNFAFECIKTPGHKEDAICIYFKDEKLLFSGDFIFKGTIGRWDLDGGNWTDMKESIDKILKYPKDLIVYPGHGDSTALKEEENNLTKIVKFNF